MLQSEGVRIPQLNLSRGVAAANISAVVAQHSTGAPCVHHLGLLSLHKVKADHLLLDSTHQQLGRPLVVSQHALHLHHVCRVMSESRQPSPYLTPAKFCQVFLQVNWSSKVGICLSDV